MFKVEPTNQKHPDNVLNLLPKINLPLFIDGDVSNLDSKAVAIVGTRRASDYGIKMAKLAAKAAVESGKTVVSGLACGIDTASHRSALDSGGRTLAVLGCGIDRIYPKENAGIAEEIKLRGALISQFPIGTNPSKKTFPIRNELVAKLCSTLILVQAPARSGSLITARFALNFGKKTLLFLGQIDDKRFEGSYNFLQKHKENKNLKIITNIDMLYDFFGATPKNYTIFDEIESDKISKPKSETQIVFEGDEKRVYDLIDSHSDGIDFDTISEFSNLNAENLPSVLLSLVLKEAIIELPGKIYKPNKEKS